jgi:hypothetical protein
MLTEFFRPADVVTPRITETTFAVEKKVTERASLFGIRWRLPREFQFEPTSKFGRIVSLEPNATGRFPRRVWSQS